MLFRTSALAVVVAACFAQPSFKPRIPTIWDDREIADMEIPVSNPAYSPHHVSAEYYYRIPVRPIYRTYPVYAPGRAPQGYVDSLREKEPEIVFDASHLRTRQDWVRAGEAVFDAPTSYDDPFKVEDTLDAEWWSTVKPPVLRDGTVAGLRYVIRKKGKVELGSLSCGTCHTRILSDGALVKGGAGQLSIRPCARMARPQESGAQSPQHFPLVVYGTVGARTTGADLTDERGGISRST